MPQSVKGEYIAMIWKMGYDLDSDKYYPLQNGVMSANLRNVSEKKMLVTQVGVTFGWLNDLW